MCDNFGDEEMSGFSFSLSHEITTEEYHQNIEIYLDEACRQYARTSTVNKQQAKEIAKLSVYLEFETNYKMLLRNYISERVGSYSRRKKEILEEKSSSIFMNEKKAEIKAWEMVCNDFPLPSPDIKVSKLKELLPSCTK